MFLLRTIASLTAILLLLAALPAGAGTNSRWITWGSTANVTSTTTAILVDESAVSGSSILAYNLAANVCIDAGTFAVKIGVVEITDATDGNVEWFVYDEMTAGTYNRRYGADVSSTAVHSTVSSNETSRIHSNIKETDDAGWDNDQAHTCILGSSEVTTANPGAGDLVAEFERLSATGSATFAITATIYGQ